MSLLLTLSRVRRVSPQRNEASPMHSWHMRRSLQAGRQAGNGFPAMQASAGALEAISSGPAGWTRAAGSMLTGGTARCGQKATPSPVQ